MTFDTKEDLDSSAEDISELFARSKHSPKFYRIELCEKGIGPDPGCYDRVSPATSSLLFYVMGET